MNRLAQIIFKDDMEYTSEVGCLEHVTGEVKPRRYTVCYSAERPLQERFTVYVDGNIVNLNQYVSEADIERIHDVYFNFKTSYKERINVTLQLQNCYKIGA